MCSTLNTLCESNLWRNELPEAEALITKALYFAPEELSVVLADDAFIQNLNAQFRGQDKPTNVLSFPSDEEDYLGDIILAFETIQHEAKEQKKSLQDHFTHMLIHGCLHLMGHDHEDEQEAEVMESKEIQLLAELGIANPYEIR